MLAIKRLKAIVARGAYGFLMILCDSWIKRMFNDASKSLPIVIFRFLFYVPGRSQTLTSETKMIKHTYGLDANMIQLGE